MTASTIVLATANPHKLEELVPIFARLAPHIRLLTLPQAAEAAGRATPAEPDEPGETFAQNARIKAEAYSRALGVACLADDSGLEVDALGGRPGVRSSHYALVRGLQSEAEARERAGRDRRNVEVVLDELRGVPAERRAARFVCCMSLAVGGREVLASRGTMEGRIGEPPRVPAGAHGFGYDPIFLVGPEYARTGAELSPDQKAIISHRSTAAGRLACGLTNMNVCIL